MGETTDKLAEKLGIKTAKPKAEPESDWFFKYVTSLPDGKFRIPNGKWKADGTPDDFDEVDALTFNKKVYAINIQILKTKIGVYESVVDRYSDEITRLESILKRGVSKAATDMEQRETHMTKVKLMWEEYRLRFRNKENTPTAKAYKARIIELERNTPAKTTLAQHHHVRDRVIHYDPKAMEAVASKRARNQSTPPVQPTQNPWEGDAENLITIYKGKIEQIEDDYLDDAKKRLEANDEWLSKSPGSK